MLLQACADRAPEPLYPAHFAREQNIDRDQLDYGLDELRRRGLVKLTDWVKDFGQGRALTEAGENALKSRNLAPVAEKNQAAQPIDETQPLGRGEVVRAAVFNPGPAWVTNVLLTANIGYFIVGALYCLGDGLNLGEYLMGSGPSAATVLRDLGALHLVYVFAHDGRPQYERILTFLFLHAGLFHLFMNMYFLGTISRLIEGIWGSWRFLTIYFVSGIVSGCMVLIVPIVLKQPSGSTVGASGCLYGIFTAMAVWFVLNRGYLPDAMMAAWWRSLGINIMLLVMINFIFSNVSWPAHLGGAIGGLLAALLFHVQRFNPYASLRWLALAGVALVPIAFFVAVLWLVGEL